MSFCFMHTVRKTDTQAGFTLVELMISVVIGMVIVFAAGYAYLSGKQSFRAQEALARMQENARFMFEELAYDFHQVGAGGCSNRAIHSSLTATQWYAKQAFGAGLMSGPAYLPVTGYDAPTTATFAGIGESITVLPGSTTDAIAVIRADIDKEYRVSGTLTIAGTNVDVPLSSIAGLSANDIVIVTDCNNTWTAQISGAPAAGKIVLTKPTSSITGIDNTRARVYKVVPHLYYVAAGTTDTTTMSLYRKTYAAGTSQTEELFSGVSDLQITYGQDTDNDGSINSYVAAGSVTNWAQVLSARVVLTLTSKTGEAVTSTGGVLTKTYRSTIALRSRLL